MEADGGTPRLWRDVGQRHTKCVEPFVKVERADGITRSHRLL